MNLTKSELRRQLLQQRRSLTLAEWQCQSELICTHLQGYLALKSVKTILAYYSFRQEPDLSSLLMLDCYHWGLPRCVEQSLMWHFWQPSQSLIKGKYGILEPSESLPRLAAEVVDLMLVPAVACDRDGYRLGYGGGYYDRLFALPEWQHKTAIGIVFDFAFLPKLPRNIWDKKLAGVCTEKGFFEM